MRTYDVYLETSAEGWVMAHVPSLPGCVARAESREEALQQIPEAITAYQAWLLRHGEAAASAAVAGGEQFAAQVVEESEGVGPFQAGDAAALFAPDREPVGPQEMEDYFRLMDHARVDLLALVQVLPPALLDWQPYPDWFSIGRVLRHVGNAEEWYTSRLVPPESLPPEWDNDADLPLFEFLEMERRTALGRLRQLTPAERSSVVYPMAWTRHPEEAWTLGKVLRRFLEHELEHTAQVRSLLDLYRRGLLARLAAEGMALLESMLGLGEEALACERVAGDRSAKGMLAYLAAQDRWEVQALAAREEEEAVALSGLADESSRREAVEASAARWRECGLAEVVAEQAAAHEAWLAWLAALPEEALFQRPGSAAAAAAAVARSRRLQRHAADLAAWRAGLVEGTAPSAVVLRAALAAARGELLAGADLILAGEAGRPVCGTWTLKDVIGHMVDWELVGVEGLRDMAAGRAPQVEEITNIDAWNELHVNARRGQSWEVLWADLHRTRHTLLEILEGMDGEALGCSFRFPWGQEGSAYQWLRVFVSHDREHAAGLRAALPIPDTYSSS